LFEFKFEFTDVSIVKDNKLRLQVTCLPTNKVLENKSWKDFADFFVVLTISNQAVAGSIIMSANRDCVLDGVLIVNVPTRSTQSMTQGYNVRFCYFEWDQAAIRISCVFALALSFDMLEKWNITIHVQYLV
jgi:hypothetical protein